MKKQDPICAYQNRLEKIDAKIDSAHSNAMLRWNKYYNGLHAPLKKQPRT
jgi:hypothetical protein